MDHGERWVTIRGNTGPGHGRHIVFISGDEEYRSEEALPMLAQVMATHHGLTCTVLFAIDPQTGMVDPNVQTNIPGMHLVASADLVVLFTRFRELPDAEMSHFVEHVFRGRPILGLRTATHAFRYTRNPQSSFAKLSCDHKSYEGGFGRQVLGETWVSHHGHHRVESTRGVPRAAAIDHPILRGVGTMWGPSDVYTANPPQDAEILVDGHVLVDMRPDAPAKQNTPTMPLAWIRHPDERRKTGRVFCSTMGAATDLRDASLRRLLVNGMYWCMGMEGQITPDMRVDPVGVYEPTDFGLRKASTGKRARAFFA